jgi:ferrous iron transport protein B
VAILVWAAAYFPHPPEVQQQVQARYRHQIAKLETAIAEHDAPRQEPSAATGDAARQDLAELQQQLATVHRAISSQVASAYMEQSILGRLGKLIEPMVRPLGWDWRIGCAVIASFPAREVVIGAMGVIYNVGEGQDERSGLLRERVQSVTWKGTQRPVFNVPVALSLMVFFSLCAQCAATLAVMRGETGSWVWPIFTFAYMTTLAYLGALATYQVGMLVVA